MTTTSRQRREEANQLFQDGEALLDRGGYEAIEHFQLYIKDYAPNDPIAHNNLGVAYLNHGNPAKAISALIEAKKLFKTHDWANEKEKDRFEWRVRTNRALAYVRDRNVVYAYLELLDIEKIEAGKTPEEIAEMSEGGLYDLEKVRREVAEAAYASEFREQLIEEGFDFDRYLGQNKTSAPAPRLAS